MSAVLAHGIGTRADLPVPLSLAVFGGGAAVLLSFLGLAALWKTSRLRGDEAGRPLPAGLAAVVDSPVLTAVLRTVALLAALVVVAAGLTGPSDPPMNVAGYAFFITFWVGLVPASLLLGPVWRRVNPLRTVYAGLARLTGQAPAADRVERLGYWPAAVALLAFAELELALPDRSNPRVIAGFVLVYSVGQLLAALWFGAGWFARGDGFEVWSTLLGRLSPWGRRTDGRLVLRSPLDGADGQPPVRGLAAVVVVLLGSTAFDGVTRTQWWQNGPGIRGDAVVGPPTLGLLGVLAVVAVLYLGATGVAGRIAGTPDASATYAHSVIPIAAGYAVAHYFSLLLLDGQSTWILASDPFGRGWDLFGTLGNAVDYRAVGTRTISVVQVVAIVVGHVVGVVLAHDRAVRVARGVAARTSQYPLLAVMVVFTCGGLYLLLG
ncbi:MAG: conserved rane protein of unknown function [Frankiales bacterium]|nr:conserved rane protein of unknown function [Frankiales bacterium]